MIWGLKNTCLKKNKCRKLFAHEPLSSHLCFGGWVPKKDKSTTSSLCLFRFVCACLVFRRSRGRLQGILNWDLRKRSTHDLGLLLSIWKKQESLLQAMLGDFVVSRHIWDLEHPWMEDAFRDCEVDLPDWNSSSPFSSHFRIYMYSPVVCSVWPFLIIWTMESWTTTCIWLCSRQGDTLCPKQRNDVCGEGEADQMMNLQRRAGEWPA